MPRPSFRLALFAALLTTLACGGAADAAERNVLFIITDDESPTLGCYGDAIAVSPAIDAVAADGIVFDNAFATTASCSASRSVVMSGLHNHANGQYGHQHAYHKFASYHNVVSLALPRVMARAGYRTARCGKYHVAPEAVYHFQKTIPGDTRNPVQMAERCRAFLTGDDADESDESDKPFFLYFATSDPHRGGGDDQSSPLELKPNLFGNRPGGGSHEGIDEVRFDPAAIVVPPHLPDTPETRSELAQYYQSCARIDQGVARLVAILKEAGLYDKTLLVFTSDHGMAFAGGKTTTYEPGLRVPLVARNPYSEARGVRSDALVSHIDLTPTMLDFAGGLNTKTDRPKDMLDANAFWRERGEAIQENRAPRGNTLRAYHGRSWLPLTEDPTREHHEELFASHTFHEIQMYYPMRVVRDRKYKLIWNIAHPLDYPFASDLWVASSWQAQLQKGPSAPYGVRTVDEYVHRPEFELFDIAADPDESRNLAREPEYADVLAEYQQKLKSLQKRYDDPWVMKWEYE